MTGILEKKSMISEKKRKVKGLQIETFGANENFWSVRRNSQYILYGEFV